MTSTLVDKLLAFLVLAAALVGIIATMYWAGGWTAILTAIGLVVAFFVIAGVWEVISWAIHTLSDR